MRTIAPKTICANATMSAVTVRARIVRNRLPSAIRRRHRHAHFLVLRAAVNRAPRGAQHERESDRRKDCPERFPEDAALFRLRTYGAKARQQDKRFRGRACRSRNPEDHPAE